MALTAEDRARLDSQKAKVLELLQHGEALTQRGADERFKVMRLASRISELRRDGWAIATEMIPAGDALVAQYSLNPEHPRIERRFLPVQAECIPAELKALRRWVVWRAGVRGDKVTKIPFSIHGFKARSNDPATWATFDQVLKIYEAGRCDGVGFVFSLEDDIVGIDLDKCVENGVANPQAQRIVEELNSYCELSVSGGGLHVICRAELAKGVRCGPLECYPHSRYFTMTGHAFENYTEIRNSQSAVDRLVALIERRRREEKRRPSAVVAGVATASDRELLEKARTARNGAKFRGLYDEGDVSGYPSHSEADCALLALLLYRTGGDEARADALFRQSALCRPKWLDRPDYRAATFARLRT